MKIAAWMLAIPLVFTILAGGRANAQVSLLMTFTSDASGVTLGGLGIGSATLGFGTVQAFGGTAPTGVTRSVVGNTWTVSTVFDIQVTGVGIVNPTYTLTAKLQSSDAVNTWKMGSVTLNGTSFSTLSTASPYLTLVPWTLSITIPFSGPSGSISNTVNFLATGN
jgi:hypothetical protein